MDEDFADDRNGDCGGEAPVRLLSDLAYSKVSNHPARWILAVTGDSPYQPPKDFANKRISTELKGITIHYFEKLGIPVQIKYTWFSTDAKSMESLADAIVEVTETKTTIRTHALWVIDEFLVTNTVLITSHDTMLDPFDRAKIDQINLLLQGVLRAESLICLKMNAPSS